MFFNSIQVNIQLALQDYVGTNDCVHIHFVSRQIMHVYMIITDSRRYSDSFGHSNLLPNIISYSNVNTNTIISK